MNDPSIQEPLSIAAFRFEAGPSDAHRDQNTNVKDWLKTLKPGHAPEGGEVDAHAIDFEALPRLSIGSKAKGGKATKGKAKPKAENANLEDGGKSYGWDDATDWEDDVGWVKIVGGGNNSDGRIVDMRKVQGHSQRVQAEAPSSLGKTRFRAAGATTAPMNVIADMVMDVSNAPEGNRFASFQGRAKYFTSGELDIFEF